MHPAYFASIATRLTGEMKCKKGDLYKFNGLAVEILESDAVGLPTRVAFHFESLLDSPNFRWVQFDWRTFSYVPFEVPVIGQSVTIAGPRQAAVSLRGSSE